MIKHILKYLKYWFFSEGKHKVHSPFVYQFITEVLENKDAYYVFPSIELVRQKLLLDKTKITVEDLGAGSTVFKSNKREISGIVKHSAKQKKYAELMFRMINYFQPKTIVELGTSVGLTTVYMAKADKQAQVYSLEGCAQLCTVAKETLRLLKVENVKIIQGNFDNTLPHLVDKQSQLDFVFFDGNHKKKPTLNYFHKCLEKKTTQSVFVFDDIHWSLEMEEAWEEIKQHKDVTLTIDLFQLGLVFFRENIEKQHFNVRF